MAYSDHHARRYQCYPTVQNDESVVPVLNSNWANSAWLTLIPPYFCAIALYALEFSLPNITAAECEIEVGLGPAGSEVVSGVVKSALISSRSCMVPWLYFFVPLEVSAFTRVAFRVRHQAGNGVSGAAVAACFYEMADATQFATRGHRGRRYPK